MKHKANLLRLSQFAASLLAAMSYASAQTTVNWEGDLSNLWATGGNWDIAPTSSLTANIANFNLASYGGLIFAPTVDTATSIAGITIGASNGAMTLTTGGLLTTGASGISIASGAGAFTISGSTTLGAAQSWLNNSSSLFSVGGGTVDNAGFLLTIGGAGNTTISSAISGSGGLTKSGAGKLTLQTASTRTGATVIDGGTLRIENATAFGTAEAAITINNGGTFELGTTTALAATTSSGTITLNAGGTISSGLAGAAARIDKTINLQNSATGVFTFDSGSNASNVLTINGGNNTRLTGGATGAKIQITGSGIIDVGETGQTRTTGVTADWYLQGGSLRMRADTEMGAAANDFYFQGGTMVTDGAFTLGASRVLNFNHASGGTVNTTGGSLTLGTAGQLAGANRLTKEGANSLILSANNTGFSGGVTLNGGIVQVNSAQALGTTGNLTFAGGSLLYTTNSAAGNDYSGRFKNSTSAISLDSNSQTVTLSGLIDSSNVGGLTKIGAGTMRLSGANSYSGATTVTAGTLSLDFTNGSNRINSGNALVMNSGTLEFANLGTNTQTFGTTTLNVGTASFITRSGTYTSGVSDLGMLNGYGVLDVSSLTGSPSWIKASGNVSQTYLLNGLVTANGGTGLVSTDASGNLLSVGSTDYANNAIIGTSPASIIRLVSGGSAGSGPNGSGFVGLSTSGSTDVDSLLNAYTSGTSTIDVTNSGTNLSNILRMGAVGVINSNSGAALTIGTTVANGGTLTAGGADNTAGALYVNANNAVTINSVIANNGSGVVGLNKAGSGILTLAAANTYTGGTTLNTGTLLATTSSTSLTLAASNLNPLGSGAVNLNGGTLQLRASGTLSTTAETIQFDNNVTVGGDATINIDRPGITSTTKTIQLGTLSIGASTLGVTGANVYALRMNGATTLTGNATFNPTTANLTLAGAVGDGSADYSLTKTGAGTLILSGTNTFSGGVFINAGTLQVASAPNLGDSANVVTFTGTSTLEFSSGTTLSQGFAINAGVTGTLKAYDKTIIINNSSAGSGTLAVSGGGTGGGFFEFTSTDNTFSGNIEIYSHSGASYAGGLTMASLNDTPGSRIKMSNTGIFNYGAGAVVPLVFNNRQIENVNNAIFNNNASDVNSTVTVNTDLLLTGGVGNRPFTLGGSNIGKNTFAGAITNGSGYVTSLTKAGGGVWNVTNASNSYTGTTTISGGTLRVSTLANAGSNSNLGAFAAAGAGGISLNGGTLQYTGASGVSVDRGFTLAASSTVDVNPASTSLTLGASSLGAFTLNVTGGSGSSLGLGALTLTGGATLNPTTAALTVASVSGTQNLTLGGTSTGNSVTGAIATSTGTLTKSGVGTWTLSGNNSYSGSTTLNAGTLKLDYSTNDTSKLSNTVSTGTLLLNGGTLELSGGTHLETVSSTTLNTGGTFITQPTGGAKLDMGAITFTGGAINFGANSIATTTSTVTNGILSQRATVAGANFAMKSGSDIVAYDYVTNGGTGYAGGAMTANFNYALVDGTSITTSRGATTNTLKITTSAASQSIAISTGQTLTLGALLFAGANDYAINTAGTGKIAATLLHNYGAGALTLGTLGAELTQYGTGMTILNGGTAGGDYNLNIHGGIVQINNNLQIGTNASAKAITLNNGILLASETLALNNAGSNSRTITLGAGGGTLAAVNNKTLTVSGVISGTGNPLTIGSGSSNGIVILSGANSYTGATTITAGMLQLGSGSTTGRLNAGSAISVASGATFAVNRSNAVAQGTDFSSAAITGAGGFAQNGAGTTTLNAINTYTGVTNVNAGTLQYGISNAIAAGAVNVGGGTLSLGAFSDTVGAVTLTSGNITGSGGTLTGSSYAVESGSISAILGGSGALTKSSAGTVTLTGGNSYSGGTTLNSGTLAFNNGSLGSTGNITFGGNSTLQWNSTNTQDVSSRIVMGNGVNSTFHTNGNDVSFATGIGTTGASLTKAGSGKLTLAASATYTGTTTVSGGTLEIQGSLASSGITNNAALTFNNSSSQSFNGAIDGSGSLTKSGAGTLTLTGTSTYGGATTVSGGILAITGTGSINSSSGISVASGSHFKYNSSTPLTAPLSLSSGSTLSGSGTIGVDLALTSTSQILAPGNSPGIQNLATTQNWSSFTYEWETNDFLATTAGSAYDQIAITGGLNLTGTTAGSYVLNVFSLTALDVAGDVPNFDEINRSWNILTTTGVINGFDADTWTLNTDGFTSDPAWQGNWSLGLNGSNDALVLSYTVIPEPKAALLGGLGILLLFRRRR